MLEALRAARAEAREYRLKWVKVSGEITEEMVTLTGQAEWMFQKWLIDVHIIGKSHDFTRIRIQNILEFNGKKVHF